jgi:hypothetical protein
VSDVAILIADALRAFLTAKVVFLEEHGSVAWSGLSPLRTGRSVLAVSSDTRRRETQIFGVRLATRQV